MHALNLSKVVSLLADIYRMKEYNSFFDRGRDVAVVGANMKTSVR